MMYIRPGTASVLSVREAQKVLTRPHGRHLSQGIHRIGVASPMEHDKDLEEG